MKQTLKPKICVYGSKQTEYVGGVDLLGLGKEIGRTIAKHGSVLMIPATTGFPMWAAMGAHEEGGFVIGFSPAGNAREHVDVYKLPIENMDVIIYSGFGYAGSDLQLSRASDAVIFGAGRLDTINQFAIAFNEEKPIGILKESWFGEDVLEDLLKGERRKHEDIFIDRDPNRLVDQLIKEIKINLK